METIIEYVREIWASVHGGVWPELGIWSYVLLALLVATEGPVSTLLGATAAAAGILDIRYVAISAFIGNVVGDCLWYSVGYLNNLNSIYRSGRWFGLRRHHLDRLEVEMHTHAMKLIALSKLAIGLIIPTLVAAGLARVPWRRWFPLVLVIETLWTIFMVNLGYHSAGLITQMERNLQLTGVALLLLVLFGIFSYARRLYRKNEEAFAAEQHLLPEPSTPAEPHHAELPSLSASSATDTPTKVSTSHTPVHSSAKLNGATVKKRTVNLVLEEAA
ncbi:MAG: hypothetical protein R3C14_25925 [Caldilineaceae bacterium]